MEEAVTGQVVVMRSKEGPSQSGSIGILDRLWDLWRIAMGRVAKSLRVPAIIRPTQFTDPVTGQRIEIDAGILSTRVTMNGRDYYFTRFGGSFAGAGTGCATNQSSCCKSDQVL